MTEPDGDNLNLMTITLTLTNPLDAGETINLSGGAGAKGVGITATYTSATVITLSGSDTDNNYEAALQELRYSNSSENPDTTTRSITVVGRDVNGNSGATSTLSLSLSVTAVNDPLVGDVTISGGQTPPVVADVLRAVTTTISDADGLGSFSYQWKRAGSDITDANSVDYTLQVADAGSAITVTVSYTDLGGTPESTSSSAIDAVDGDLDGDSIGDSSDLDIDGDGMLNTYEDANGLNKLDATDRDTDLDGDGVSNYDEFLADSDAMADDYPPVVTPPADVNVDAEGLFTLVTIGSATAVDDLDGDVSVTSDAPTHFAPGENTVTWSATDAAGNTGTATQSVNVTPLVELGKDQVTAEGASATFEVMLNGPAVTYPVTVPYSVSGTALTDGSDHDLVDGSVTITSPNLSTTVTVNVVDDGAGEGMESLIVTLGDPTNAVLGPIVTHALSIYEERSPDVSVECRSRCCCRGSVGRARWCRCGGHSDSDGP
ncbi:Calx-beta domain-containing protein [Candidatus Reidiella endopervernicosa]|uniref:Calx-beta domain-containing protein n=1 Tax=Candidatus Reidiella endopervernicosa TaxID=2738883 RepID=A0A6N0HWX0_9GAMM|nr:Calx-beta domain-containing protein [Candidatus Reidiella endopervernicosa]QKQ26858.1 hypothetical protein HUE57_11640 [Candidatus Reidiella endopervernicosa]